MAQQKTRAWWWMAGIALVAVLTAGVVAAQQSAPPTAGSGAVKGDRSEWRGGRHAGYHHGFGRGFGMGFALGSLDLTDAQREQVHAVMQRHRDEFRASADKTMQARHALRTASEAGSVDENAIRTAASALGEAEGELAILHAKVRSEVWDLLTAEQREKAEALRQQRQQRLEQQRLDRQQRRQGTSETPQG